MPNTLRHLALSMGFAMLAGACAAAPVTPTDDGESGSDEVAPLSYASGVVSFTFDDNYRSQLTEAAPILAARGFAATEYTAILRLTEEPDEWGSPFMRWEDLSTLRSKYHWEIASHSMTHQLLSTVSAADLDWELRQSKQVLADHGFDVVSFAAPYGDYDDDVLRKSATLYQSFRPFHDTDSLNRFPVDRSLLYVKQVQAGGTDAPSVSVAQAKAWIDQAASENAWLVFVFHEIQDRPAAEIAADNVAWGYGYPSEDLAAIADYCVTKGVAVRTVAQVLKHTTAKNRITNGEFTNGMTGFQTDRPTRVKLDTNGHGALPSPKDSVALKGGAQNAHLFAAPVAITKGAHYTLETYVEASQLTQGSVGFYVDEWDDNGTWVSGQYIRDVPESPGRRVQHVTFGYVPGPAARKASLQIILSPGAKGVAYVDAISMYPGTLVY